jgi:hypothetical protein
MDISINSTYDSLRDESIIILKATKPNSTVWNIITLGEYEKKDKTYESFDLNSISFNIEDSFQILKIKVPRSELNDICRLNHQEGHSYFFNCSLLFTFFTTENLRPFKKIYTSMQLEFNETTESTKQMLSLQSLSAAQTYAIRPDIPSKLELCNDTSCTILGNKNLFFFPEEILILWHFLEEEGDRESFYLSLISVKIKSNTTLIDITNAVQSLCNPTCEDSSVRIQFALLSQLEGRLEIIVLSQLRLKNQRRAIEDKDEFLNQTIAVSSSKVIYVVHEGMSLEETRTALQIIQQQEEGTHDNYARVQKSYEYLWVLVPVLVFVLLALGGAGAIIVKIKKKKHQKLEEEGEIVQDHQKIAQTEGCTERDPKESKTEKNSKIISDNSV